MIRNWGVVQCTSSRRSTNDRKRATTQCCSSFRRSRSIQWRAPVTITTNLLQFAPCAARGLGMNAEQHLTKLAETERRRLSIACVELRSSVLLSLRCVGRWHGLPRPRIGPSAFSKTGSGPSSEEAVISAQICLYFLKKEGAQY
jgi:hypothetical protein